MTTGSRAVPREAAEMTTPMGQDATAALGMTGSDREIPEFDEFTCKIEIRPLFLPLSRNRRQKTPSQ